MHHIDFFFYIFFVLTCSLLLVFSFVLLCVFVLILTPCLGKLEPRTPSTSSVSPSRSELFRNDKSREVYEKLNCKRKIWTERSVMLVEVDPAIRENFESRGWLPLLEVDHPPPTALIKEFFSNLSYHVYDSNTLIRSWIQGVEFTITPRIVAEALGVPIVREPVYPYEETPPLDDVMSYIIRSSIQWGSDPRITSAELTEPPIFSLG